MLSASKTSAPSASGYNINNSLRFRSSASAYLSRTPASAGNRQVWTWSCWVKKTPLASGVQAMIAAGVSTTVYDDFCFENDQIRFVFNNGTYDVKTTQVFRDPSAWYHVIVAMDTTQATASNRVKIYVNGSQVTAFATANYPAQNHNTNINNNILNNIGNLYNGSFSSYFDGYMTEVNFIDGSAKTPSDFGQTDTTTGVWKPKAYSGTYGTNGFYLKFSDIATTSGSNAGLGKDFSGNTNYWTTNNISVTSGTTYDAMTDSPTNTSATVANYATLNYIDTNTASSISGANLNWVDAGGIDREIRGTIGVSSGKYYWEVVLTSSNTSHVGVDTLNSTLLTDYLGSTSTSWSIYLATGNKRNAGSNTSYGSSLAANDIMMCALDMDNGKIWWGKNGTWFASGDPAAGTNAAFTNLSGYTIAFAATPRSSCSVNFGQRPFSYTPPTGFVALNTYNLPTPTILQGNKYMDATLYTGTGSTQSITNAGVFKPDLVWTKSRSNAYNSALTDSVRGVAKGLFSDLTNAEDTASPTSYVQAFNSNGFSVNIGSNSNANGATYVGWQWQAGQGTTSSNTSGSITSTVSVNTTAGFSIVTWTGTGSPGTVGHGLGVAPKMVISKKRNGTSDWAFWITGFAGTELMEMNSTSGKFTGTTVWNSTTPTSTVFSVGSATQTNNSGGTYVAYLWAEIAGFSKFGSYTGNGSTDGPFVYTGFRPRFIMIKRSDATSGWGMIDTARGTFNSVTSYLQANDAAAEQTDNQFDILSNGFKCRLSGNLTNTNGGTYIYMAFAESPFKVALAR